MKEYVTPLLCFTQNQWTSLPCFYTVFSSFFQGCANSSWDNMTTLCILYVHCAGDSTAEDLYALLEDTSY